MRGKQIDDASPHAKATRGDEAAKGADDGAGAEAAGAEAGITDVSLVQAMAQGDRQALAVLYDRYAPRLLGVAERLMGSPVDAEDLLHDLFIEVFYQAKTYDKQRGSVSSWLLIRLRSRALDRLRSPAYRRILHLNGENPPVRAGEAQARIDPYASELAASALKSAIAAMPQDIKEILNRVYFQGMSLPDVASEMNVPLGTVKSRLHRALRSLRGVIADKEDSGA